MAEISYPFAENNPTNGASKAVSELQWQAMASMWGGDRVDYTLPSSPALYTDLPFNMSVISVTSVQVNAGRAWVGGFYYELTAPLNVAIEANPNNTGRIDLVVLRVNMGNPSVNLAVRKGLNSASPIVPQPVRQAADVWELPLAQVSVPANGGTISVATRQPFNMPPAVTYPWDASASTALTPPGTFGYDMDSNGSGYQSEYFNGRQGVVTTRTLGPMTDFTPALLNDSSLPSTGITYKGRWRWIAPGTVSFNLSVYSTNPSMATDSNTAYGIRLPVPASTSNRQVFSGYLSNPFVVADYPSSTSLTGLSGTGSGSSYFAVYLPSPGSTFGGLDNFRTFPKGATVYFSGTYEANTFDNGSV